MSARLERSWRSKLTGAAIVMALPVAVLAFLVSRDVAEHNAVAMLYRSFDQVRGVLLDDPTATTVNGRKATIGTVYFRTENRDGVQQITTQLDGDAKAGDRIPVWTDGDKATIASPDEANALGRRLLHFGIDAVYAIVLIYPCSAAYRFIARKIEHRRRVPVEVPRRPNRKPVRVRRQDPSAISFMVTEQDGTVIGQDLSLTAASALSGEINADRSVQLETWIAEWYVTTIRGEEGVDWIWASEEAAVELEADAAGGSEPEPEQPS